MVQPEPRAIECGIHDANQQNDLKWSVLGEGRTRSRTHGLDDGNRCDGQRNGEAHHIGGQDRLRNGNTTHRDGFEDLSGAYAEEQDDQWKQVNREVQDEDDPSPLCDREEDPPDADDHASEGDTEDRQATTFREDVEAHSAIEMTCEDGEQQHPPHGFEHEEGHDRTQVRVRVRNQPRNEDEDGNELRGDGWDDGRDPIDIRSIPSSDDVDRR